MASPSCRDVRLPTIFRIAEPPLQCAAGSQPLPGRSTEPAVKPARRILLVDDDADTGETLVEILGMWGYDALWADTAAAALERLQSYGPDTILLDISLPDLSGYDLARRLREELGYVSRLAAITGYGSAEDRCRSREAGFDQHFTKPVCLESLRCWLEQPLLTNADR